MNDLAIPSLIIQRQQRNKLMIGWEEWCSLPALGLPAIKAKIDTGAKTSALHAFNIRPFQENGIQLVAFCVYPLQRNRDVYKTCTAEVIDERVVMNSGGHKELRYVIKTPLILGDQRWDIEITLSNREPLTFRMLLGREALNGHVIIDPMKSMRQGKPSLKVLKQIYQPTATAK
jgi:ribosomal protein S6--L-glutamate ligase